MKTNWISFLRLNKFDFGGRIIYQFVIFECKFLFSIHIFYFVRSFLRQDRYHTHAFDSLSIKLFGSYNEYVLINEKTGEYRREERTKIFKWFPRGKNYNLKDSRNDKDYYHCIGESKKGCITILLTGPWKSAWKEWINGEIKWYHWGRKGEIEIN